MHHPGAYILPSPFDRQRSFYTGKQRRTKSAAEDFAKRHGVPRFYTDVDELLNDPEVDAIYVATPPGSHKDLALRVCSAGKPCYVEKPMARQVITGDRGSESLAFAWVLTMLGLVIRIPPKRSILFTHLTCQSYQQVPFILPSKSALGLRWCQPSRPSHFATASS